MVIIRWLCAALVVLAVVAFALQNQKQTVMVVLGTYKSPHIPLFLAIYIAFAAGMVVYFMLALAGQLRLRGELSRYRRECGRLKDELNRLRNLNLDKELETIRRNRSTSPAAPIVEIPASAREDEVEGWGA